jgi:glycosyltransferase involved in cell wall biosynthesis
MKEKKLQISVLMSIYNENKREIKESIESILEQSLKNFEFIIVNDNPDSKDLRLILSYYKEKDNRIRLINNKKNIGLARSMNKAAAIAKTDIFARMDADDTSEKKRLEIQYKTIKNNTYDVIFSDYLFIDENSKIIPNTIDNQFYSPESLNRILPYISPIHHPTVMMTREIFEKVGGYRNFPCSQDRDLWLRIWERGGKFFMINEKLLRYRMRSNRTSVIKKYQQKITIDYIQDLFIQRLLHGADDYSMESYIEYLKKNKFENTQKINEMYKYTNLLSKSKKYQQQKMHFMSTLLRAQVFIFSPVYRKSFLKRIKIMYALKRYKK